MHRDEPPFGTMTRRELLGALGAGVAGLAGAGRLSYAATQPPRYEIRQIEHTWIPMRDGTRLAARIWLPVGASGERSPAIFNYCPYFARLFTRPGDDAMYPYFVSRGYACVRVDIRGSGNSEGRPLDEYVEQEQDDALEIIDWISKQPWCTGAVGMEGISWSGFNSLQVAARRPPALKAIITHCSTDDRYSDDAHFKGGAVIHDMFAWGTVFLAFQGQAPDPAIVGVDGWRERWLERLNAVEFNLGHWFDHLHRDAFWKHASVIEDYGAIQCPVYAIGGWVDGYKNSVFRLLAGLEVPRKGLVGPWTHIYPHQGVPGPAIGYLDEALRWWDHWLKRSDTGIMQEPMLRVWMQDAPARPGLATVPGRWVGETAWPSERMSEQSLYLSADRTLVAAAPREGELELAPLQTVGIAGGNWCPSGAGAAEDLDIEIASDQRVDDARSLTLDSAPLAEPLEFLGNPSLLVDVAADKPVAYLAVRLNMVEPTGESWRLTYGILNLCQRESSEHPTALEPGRRYRVRVPLDAAAQRVPRGARLRVAISSSYWPMVLPSPAPVTLTVYTGSSRLVLPIRPQRAADTELAAFGPPVVPAVAVEPVSGQPGSRRIEWDVAKQRQVIRHNVGNGVVRLTDIDTRLVGNTDMRCEIVDDSTESEMTYEYTMGWERDRWRPRTIARSKTVTTATEISIRGELKAWDGDTEVFARTWEKKVRRDLV